MLHNAHNAHPKKVFIIMAIIALFIVGTWFYLNNKNTQPLVIVAPNTVYTDQNTKLETKYINTPDSVWPPKVNAAKGKFTCTESDINAATGMRTIKKIIAGKTYCISSSSQGAAGSTYTTYQYDTLINGKVTSIIFSLRFSQCMNYVEPQQSECLQERQIFDIDGLANAIIENARL